MLSVDETGNRGIVATLSNAITADVLNLDTLSNDMKTLSGTLTADINVNRQNIDALSSLVAAANNSLETILNESL